MKAHDQPLSNISGSHTAGPCTTFPFILQNGFDDFAAAAEYLVTNDYTRAGKLAIKGGSNGGLLTGNMLARPTAGSTLESESELHACAPRSRRTDARPSHSSSSLSMPLASLGSIVE